ncbi:unnamed protein product, partial [marine sediment metagenome]
DFPNRERFVKTGFPSWKKKWRKIAIKRYKKYQRNKLTERDNIKGRANIKYELKLEKPISIRESTSKSQRNR